MNLVATTPTLDRSGVWSRMVGERGGGCRLGVCLGVSAITWQFGLAGGSDGNYRRNVFFEQQFNKMIRILLKVMAIHFKVFIISIRKKSNPCLPRPPRRVSGHIRQRVSVRQSGQGLRREFAPMFYIGHNQSGAGRPE